PVGIRARGVIAMQLKDDEYIINAGTFVASESEPDVYVVTQRGFHKKMRMNDFPLQERTNRGQTILRALKSNPHSIEYMFLVSDNDIISIITSDYEIEAINIKDLNYSERISNGSLIKRNKKEDYINNIFVEAPYHKLSI